MSAKVMKASVIIGGSISSSFRSALSTTRGGLKAIGEEITRVETRQRTLNRTIETFGRTGKNIDRMRAEYGALARDADKLRAAQTRLANVQSRIDANNARRQALGGQFRGAVAMLGAASAAAFFPVRQAVEFETAMLGVQKQLDGARDAAGNLTPEFFKMGRDIQLLGREVPVATNKLADMVAAGLRMGISASDVLGFTRDTAKMATAFEMEEGPLADSMGKIAGIFRIPISAIGDLGDAINYLDDKSIAKGGDILKVMQGDLAGAAATMGLSAKNAAALASTFLTLGESAERADTAAAGMMRQLQIAKMNPKRFQVGVQMLGLNADQLQKGMIDDPQAMILNVLGRIKKLPVEQQMEAVTRLFGKDWGGAIAKLANGVDEYRRQLDLANGAEAKGSMSREFEARTKTVAARWQMTKNRISEVAVVIGNALTPSIGSLLGKMGPLIDKVGDFARENPGMIRGIVGTALALTGLRVVTLGAAYAWTALKTPVLSVMGFIARWRATNALAAMGRFGPLAMRVAKAVRVVGAVLAGIGGGPIAIAVAALTAGALVVRKYWQPIGAWIGGMFRGIREVAGPALADIGRAVAPLKPLWAAVGKAVGDVWNWFVRLLEPVNMTSAQLQAAGASGASFGRIIGASLARTIGLAALMIRNVVTIGRVVLSVANVIANSFASAWGKAKAIVGAAVDWIVNRVRPIINVASAIGGTVANVVGVGGTPAAAGDMPAAPRGRTPPAPPSASGARGRTASVTHAPTFNITQQPGESGEALARRIAAMQQAQASIDRRGQLADGVA